MEDKDRAGRPKNFEDVELQALLDENPSQTLKEFTEQLNVNPRLNGIACHGKEYVTEFKMNNESKHM